MKLPIIDFSDYDEAEPETIKTIARDMERALTTLGFMSISNLDVTREQLAEIFTLSEAFFAQSKEVKQKSLYRSAEENFGYQGLGVEYLDPTKPADVKETFTMRNLLHHDPADERWPSDFFRDKMTRFYACLLYTSPSPRD